MNPCSKFRRSVSVPPLKSEVDVEVTMLIRPEARIEAVESAVDQIADVAIDVVRVVQVPAGRSEVVRVGDDAVPELALHADEPVVHEWTPQVRIHGGRGHARADDAIARVETDLERRIDRVAEIRLARHRQGCR